MKGPAPKTRDYFAEMYVAGLFADHGWNVYFPRRDEGFDFIVTKKSAVEAVIRPVQVKGLYPTESKKSRSVFGYQGKLSQIHEEMVLAIVFFGRGAKEKAPVHVAFMPRSEIRRRQRGGWRSVPASLTEKGPSPRKEFQQFFDAAGLERLEEQTPKAK